MREIVQFLETYAVWIALGGALLFVVRRRPAGGTGCCSIPEQPGEIPRPTAAVQHAGSDAGRVVPTANAAMQLAELREREERLRREIAEVDRGEAGQRRGPRARRHRETLDARRSN